MRDEGTSSISAVEPDFVLNTPPAAAPGVQILRSTMIRSVAVLGLGYVGLPTALSLFGAGKRVVGVDHSKARVENINQMSVDLVDSDMRQLDSALGHADFELACDVDVLSRVDAVVICVPTPIDSHLVPDLTMLHDACTTVVEQAREGQLIVLTSTSYVGTTRDELIVPLAQRGLIAGDNINVAFSPERIDPANQISHSDVPRVIGGETQECGDKAAELFGCVRNTIHLVSSPETAELTKLYENTFRAVNVALVNELADISHVLGIDVAEVIDAASTKPYGFMPFRPGPGVGGHCIPCDPHYLTWQLKERRVAAPLIEQAMQSIVLRPGKVVDRIVNLLAEKGKRVSNARILVYGVAYKPGVADVRESPAVEIIETLMALGAVVAFFDSKVPTVRLHNDTTLTSAPEIDIEWDLVVAHTLHDHDVASEWLSRRQLVLDATYSLDHGANVVQL